MQKEIDNDVSIDWGGLYNKQTHNDTDVAVPNETGEIQIDDVDDVLLLGS